MVAKSKVRAKDKFELMFYVRKKEKEGWSRWGKPYQRTHEGKHITISWHGFLQRMGARNDLRQMEVTMTYYSTEKILEIIKHYHTNMQNIKEWQRDHASVGVVKMGIEATMPKANTLSDVVANE